MTNIPLSRYRAVFFDLFHTLLHVEEADSIHPRTNEVLGVSILSWREQAFTHSEDRLTGKLNDPVEIIGRMARAIDPDISDEIIERATIARAGRFADAFDQADPANVAALNRVREVGLTTCLVSNADSCEIAGWGRSPLAACFDAVVFSYQVGYAKPHPGIYRKALEAVGQPPEACLFVGDGSCDELRGAREVGLTTVLTTQYLKTWQPEKIADRRLHADYVIDHLDELAG